MRHAVILLAAGLAFFTSTSAHADTITFEGASGFAGTPGTFFDVDGFRFTFDGPIGDGFLIIIGQSDIVEGGTTKLFAANHAQITMTKIGGGAFSLLGLDVGGSFISFPGRWADSVDVTGGGNTVHVPLPSNDPTYQSANTNFLNVMSVIFVPFQNPNHGVDNYEYTLDNLVVGAPVVAPVPEPTAIALLGLGALGVLCYRRRQSA